MRFASAATADSPTNLKADGKLHPVAQHKRAESDERNSLPAFTTVTPPPSDNDLQRVSSMELRAASVLCGQATMLPGNKKHDQVVRLQRR
jgi:hypothetical protein